MIKKGTICQRIGCNNYAIVKYAGDTLCASCLIPAKEQQKKRDIKRRKKDKKLALNNAMTYFNAHLHLLLKMRFKNKKQIIPLICDFYTFNPLSEPMFNILVVDIINLLGGNAASQYPFPSKKKTLVPRRADAFDRKNQIVIETKAAFFNSCAQRQLKKQTAMYKRAFKGCTFLAISPDNQNGTLGIVHAIPILVSLIK